MNQVEKHIYTVSSKIWHAYAVTRDSPADWGSKNRKTIAIFLMYSLSFAIAITMTVSVLRHQTVFTSLKEKTEGSDYEMASLLICPEKSKIYNYSFFHHENILNNTGLPVDVVNFLAKASFENKLDDSGVTNLLKYILRNYPKFRSQSVKKLWLSLISELYDTDNFPFDEIYDPYKFYHQEANDIDCLQSGRHYPCQDIRGIWLTDKSYCFIWNYTSVRKKIQKQLDVDSLTSNFIFHMNGMMSYRIWIGNLRTNLIEFDSFGQAANIGDMLYELEVVQQTAGKPWVCQPLLDFRCSLEFEWIFNSEANMKEIIAPAWRYITKKVPGLPKKDETKYSLAIRLKGWYWYELKSVTRFTNFKAFEIFGNMVSLWTGASVFALLKLGLAYAKRKYRMRKYLILAIQVIVVSFLLIMAVALEYHDWVSLQSHRFTTQLQMVSSNNIPYPSFSIRFKTYQAGINHTMLKSYNISHPLFVYIFSTSLLTFPYINTRPSKNPKFFIWNKEMPTELGYHWNFMQFPLQNISQTLYEEKMTAVEREYKSICKKFDVDPKKPSWIILEKVMLQPCAVIKYCYIDGKKDTSCCNHFRTVRHIAATIGWEYRSHPNYYQSKPGAKYGIRVVMDPKGLQSYMPEVYLDTYMLKVVKKCKNAKKCDKKAWVRRSNIELHVSHFNGLPLFRKLRTTDNNLVGRKRDISLTMTKHTMLDYNPDNNCSESSHRRIEAEREFRMQAIFFMRCGCYACNSHPEYYTQAKPCCSPKVAGRCITKFENYDSLCYMPGTGRYLEKNRTDMRRQFWYAGNLSTDVPVDLLLSNGVMRCRDQIITNPQSKFYHDDRKIELTKDMTVQKCHFDVYKRQNEVVHPKITSGPEKNLFELNLYFPLTEYLNFEEKDLQNIWELIGLFFGGVGLCFGLTYINVIELIVGAFVKLTKKCGSSTKIEIEKVPKAKKSKEVLITWFYFFGLKKFAQRIYSLMRGKNTKRIAENNAESKNNMRSEEAPKYDDSNLAFESNARLGEAGHPFKVPTGENISTDLVEEVNAGTNQQKRNCSRSGNEYYKNVGKMISKTVSHNIQRNNENDDRSDVPRASQMSIESFQDEKDEQNRRRRESSTKMLKKASTASFSEENLDDDNDDFGDGDGLSTRIETLVLCMFIVALAIGLLFSLIGCYHLYQSMGADKVNTMFELSEVNISVPSVCICYPHNPQNLYNSSVSILNELESCKLRNIEQNCSVLFKLFLKTEMHSCILTSYFNLQWNSREIINDVEVKLPATEFEVWVGDLKSLNRGELETHGKLRKGYQMNVMYEEWQSIHTDQTCENDVSHPCPLCTNAYIASSSRSFYCCTDPDEKIFHNFTAPKVKYCSSSSYSLALMPEKSSALNKQSLTLLAVQSEYRIKRVLKHEARRTFSEKLMLYAGFVDIFIGLNIDNIVYVAIAGLGTVLVKFFVTKTDT